MDDEMKQKIKNQLIFTKPVLTGWPHDGLTGDCTSLQGDCTGLQGDCTGLQGDCTGLQGDCTEIKVNQLG